MSEYTISDGDQVLVPVPVKHRTKTALAISLLIGYGFARAYIWYWQLRVLSPFGTLYQYMNVTVACPPGASGQCLAAGVGIGQSQSMIAWKSFDLVLPWGGTLPWFRALFGGLIPVYSSDFPTFQYFGTMLTMHYVAFMVIMISTVLMFVALRAVMVIDKNVRNDY